MPWTNSEVTQQIRREIHIAKRRFPTEIQVPAADSYDAIGQQTVNGTPITVNIGTQRTNSNTDVFDFTANVLTVTKSSGGSVDLSYRATVGNTGADDFAFDVYLERAPASTGIFAEVPGTRIKSGKGT